MSSAIPSPASPFTASPRSNPPDALRPLDRSVMHWVLQHGGDATLARAAAWASLADGQGDSALMLEPAHAKRLGIPDIDNLAQHLRSCADAAGNTWVAHAHQLRPDQPSPFVLDDSAFYLLRNFLDETAVARQIRKRLETTDASNGADDNNAFTLDQAALDLLFQGPTTPQDTPQREAVRAALGRRLFILTGGPGSGKTTTVLRLLMAQIAHFSAHYGQPPVLRLAAPTGKAAQRLSQALRSGASGFNSALPEPWQSALEHALSAETSTLHRLLGHSGNHGNTSQLPADIVLVDEASMIDLGLLRKLLDALRDDAILLLVGDADQLPPVGIGSALSDLVQALENSNALARLRHSFRASSQLVGINEALRQGDAHAFDTAFQQAHACAVRHPLPDLPSLHQHLTRWSQLLAHNLQNAAAFQAHDEHDHTALLQALAVISQQQLLCALREGRFGAVQANLHIEQQLRKHPDLAPWAERNWYPGRLVIITRNDYSTGLFNGDVGLCLRLRDAQQQERLAVVFPAPPDAAPQPRCFNPDSLPEHEPAFALTVHKSQGSEYQHIAVLLPPPDSLGPGKNHPLLIRPMLYTALSRARQSLELWSDPAPLTTCIHTQPKRAGKLVLNVRGDG